MANLNPQDPLSDLLRSVHLRGALYFYMSFAGAWAAEARAASVMAPMVMPGAGHLMEFHLLAKGEGWAATGGLPPVRLHAGDIVMFPHGDAHVISSAPGLRPPPVQESSLLEMCALPKPVPITYQGTVRRQGESLPFEQCDAVLLCGFIGCDAKPFNPLIDALPRLVHLPSSGVGEWIAPALRQAAAESRLSRAGSAAVLERVSEMLFVDAARRYLESLPEGTPGWLGALRDRHVGRAIALMHQRPAEAWTVEQLGREVGLSRSALHERFVGLVGQPPMQYLANWRIQRGAALLRESSATVATVALEVGYESEAAFSRAFKRLVGVPPATWRRRQSRAAVASSDVHPEIQASAASR